MSFFKTLSTLPEDPIFSLSLMYARSQNLQKVNLGIGVYRDAFGKSKPFSCIKAAEKELIEKNLSKEYLPIDGDADYKKALLDLIFKEKSAQVLGPNIYAAQTIGGTGALRLGAELVSRDFSRLVFIPEISWPNHFQIFRTAGMQIHTYPYPISDQGQLDFGKLCQSVEDMPPGSLILLHACCHNPTGVDLTLGQWQELSKIIRKGMLLPFFDFAYHGLGTSLEADAAGLRFFYAAGHEMMLAYSCSKNFGLYGERTGLLAIVTHEEQTENVASHIKSLIRSDYSNPPLQGSRLVKTVLQSENLRKDWEAEVKEMGQRCQTMRKLLAKGLSYSRRDFSFLARQQGLFSLTGLTKAEVLQLRDEYGVVLPDNGRINIAALTEDNVLYVADAIVKTIGR